MWKATWNKYWGTRSQTTFIILYFTTKPTKSQVTKAFRKKGHPVDSSWETRKDMSGYISLDKISFEF